MKQKHRGSDRWIWNTEHKKSPFDIKFLLIKKTWNKKARRKMNNDSANPAMNEKQGR